MPNRKTPLLFFLLLNLIAAGCPEADYRCTQCGGDRCLECIDSFSNSSGICIQVKNKIANCLSYKDENECQKCQRGFLLNETGACALIPLENCLELDLNGDCYLCKNRLRAVNGICSSQSCNIDNCQICSFFNNTEVCHVCKSNFFVYPSEKDGVFKLECLHENGRAINCEIARFNDRNQCVKCRVNYYFADGKCLRSPEYTYPDLDSFGQLFGFFFLFNFFTLNFIS